MNNRQRGILYGLSFGDGCLHRQAGNKNYGLTIGHGPKQREYLEWKASTLHSIFGGKSCNINTYVGHNKTTNKDYTNLQLRKVDPYFNSVHKNLYPTGKKVFTRKSLDFLTDLGLAIWFMDDGSGVVCKNKRGHSCGCMIRISVYGSKEEAEEIALWFLETYQLVCKFDVDKRNSRYSIRFGTQDSKTFAKIVEQYVIPSMQYKIQSVLNYNPRVLDTLTGNTEGEDIV